MLRSVGRKGLGSICDCASALRTVRNSAPNGISSGAADQTCRVLGLGPTGPSCQSARTFVGGCNNLLPGSVKQATQGLLFPNQSASRLGTRDGPLQFTQLRGFIQLKTNLEVADNSGARRVQCIKVMKGSNAGQIGDKIMASVKDAQPRGKVKKGEVVTCIVVRAATHKLRRDGSEIRFDKNAVVLVNKQGEPIGTRVFGPVPHELRRRKLLKILTLAEYVV